MNKGNEKGKQSRTCRILAKELLYAEKVSSFSGLASLSNSGGADVEDIGMASIHSGDVYRLRLAWDGDAYAGCFFELLTRNEYLRRPISLCGKGEGYIELAIRVAGSGTKELVSRPVGDVIECFGPMGRGFELPMRGRLDTADEEENCHEKRYLVVGGGIGVAPLQPLLQELTSRRVEVDADMVIEEAVANVELWCRKGYQSR